MFIQVIDAVPDHSLYLLLMKISYIKLGHMDLKTTVFSRVAIRRTVKATTTPKLLCGIAYTHS